MPVIDALKILEAGKELRGSIELDDVLLSWRARFDGHRTLTVVLDELSLDESIPFGLAEPLPEGEPEPDDFPGA
jgi:hypothetical protein